MKTLYELLSSIPRDRNKRISMFPVFLLSLLLAQLSNAQNFQVLTTSNSNLPSNHIKALYMDPYGHLWIGTDKGLVLRKNDEMIVYTPDNFVELADKNINDLGYQWSAYAKKHEIWVTTQNGITVSYFDTTGLPVDAVSGATIYRVNKDSENMLLSDTVTKVHLDTNYTRWFATHKGVSYFKGQKWGHLTSTTHPNSIPNQPVSSIGSYKKNNEVKIFIGTKDRIGRVSDKVDGITGATFFEQPWEYGLEMTTQDIRAITVVDTIQWYGTTSGLTYKKGWVTKADWVHIDHEPLNSQVIKAIYVASNGDVFAGTENAGVFIVRNDVIIGNLTMLNGLASNNILDFEMSASGRLYIATDNGLNYSDEMVSVNKIDLKPSIMIYPNPASDFIRITFETEESRFVSIRFLDINGRTVNYSDNRNLPGGKGYITWNLKDINGIRIPAGIYFVQVYSGNKVKITGKFVVR